MEFDGINRVREVKVERTHRIKRTGEEKQGEKDNKRSFSDMLERDMDEVELHEEGANEQGDNLQVSTDVVSISGPGLVGSETRVASNDVVDLEATRKLAEKIKQDQPGPVLPETMPPPPEDGEASVDTLA